MLGENTKKYITFTVSIEKEVTRINEDGEQITKNVPSILNLFIAQDSWQAHYPMMSIIFSEEIDKIKCKYGHDKKNLTLAELNISSATVFLNTQTLKIV